MLVRIRFYVGLRSATDGPIRGPTATARMRKRSTLALNLFRIVYPAGTAFDTMGHNPDGTVEPGLVLETIQDADETDARAVAYDFAADIARDLQQGTVGLSIEPASFTLVKAKPASDLVPRVVL